MKIEVRNDKVIIDGYVNAVDRFSKILYDKKGQFIEKILPTVFRRALEKNPSVKVLLDHDYDKELANTKNGTAELYEDNIGLRAIVEITDSDVIEVAKATKQIVMQNIVIALGIKSVFLILGALGIAGMWEAVFGDVGVTIIAVLNAMRILKK